jgi:electron transfer flavoprotein alpha subunit
MSILVFVESDEGNIKKTSLEAVAYAHAMAGGTSEVTAIAFGAAEPAELEAMVKYGAHNFILAAD